MATQSLFQSPRGEWKVECFSDKNEDIKLFQSPRGEWKVHTANPGGGNPNPGFQSPRGEWKVCRSNHSDLVFDRFNLQEENGK